MLYLQFGQNGHFFQQQVFKFGIVLEATRTNVSLSTNMIKWVTFCLAKKKVFASRTSQIFHIFIMRSINPKFHLNVRFD